MTTSACVLHGRSLGLDRWWLPFLWVSIVPIAAAALSAGLFFLLAREGSEVGLPGSPGDCLFCEYKYFEVNPVLTALPGLFNLGPFLWLLSRARRVRIASRASGLLGLVQLAMPAVLLFLASDGVTGPGFETYFRTEASELLLLILLLA